jgi:N-acetylglutamate synthase
LIRFLFHGRMNPDSFAIAMTDSRRHMNTRIPGSRLLRQGGAAAWITGSPRAGFNSVWPERPNPPASAVAALLDEVADAGLPFTLALRPGSAGVLTGLAAERGMRRAGDHPLMALETGGAKAPRPVPQLAIRLLPPHEATAVVKVAAAVFGATEETFLPSLDLLALDGLRCYLGEADGQPVATAVSVTTGQFTAIYSVATDPAFRRRGFGTALTARAVADGALAGAAWCWLKASASGYPVYRDLGFRTIETWTHWMSRP